MRERLGRQSTGGLLAGSRCRCKPGGMAGLRVCDQLHVPDGRPETGIDAGERRHQLAQTAA